MYVFDRAVEPLFPSDCPWSLERDLLPRLTSQGFYGFVTSSSLHDIGTPERLARFRDVWQETSVSPSVLPLRREQGSPS
jgi:NDP-sugar pyrophosphorylase family protein